MGSFYEKFFFHEFSPDPPEIPELPAPIEEVDLEGDKEYTKTRMKRRKGRRSTILGSNNKGKTVLG